MYIIGTAGHVDHGKTLLIKALTGIDTDRLPEEKKRGLTIDLGFAHFPGTDGTEIGVVDVPGHERFIRNMTAGAWGVDLALLVVAADDGWMYQSENHLNVLAAMGIEKIIVVVTKTDIAEPDRIKDVAGYAAAAVEEKTGRTPATIGVSAEDGNGIDELRSLIIEKLTATNGSAPGGAVSDSGSPGDGNRGGRGLPLLYIDRVFNVKGTGLVVTGSLREGPVSRDDTLLLLPEGKEVRVRGLQSYDRETPTAVPACRTAINITGATPEELSRGHCLTTADSGFTAETEAVIMMSGKHSGIRNHSGAEFAAGTAHSIGTIHFMKNTDCARIVLEEPLSLRSGQPLVVIRKGGSRITGSGIVIWKGETTREERLKLASAAESVSLPFSGISEMKLSLAVAGRLQLNTASGTPASLPENSVLCGNWLFSKEAFKKLSAGITASASAPGGVSTVELQSKLDVPDDAVKAVCSRLTDDGLISVRGGILFTGSSRAPELSPAAKQILAEAEKGGKLGFDLNTINIPGVRKELRNLTREGLIIPLTDRIFYRAEDFRNLTGIVLDGLKKGDTFDIAHTKNRTGLSRKYIIPLLEKMEEKGMVKREDSVRRVL